MRIKVLGAGSWGTALALVLYQNGHNVSMWTWDSMHAEKLMAEGENKAYLPGIPLPQDINISSNLSGVASAEMVLFSVPSHAVNQVAQQVKEFLRPETIIISTGKGFYSDNQLRLSQVIQKHLPDNPLAVLSGPTHAEEVGRALPTAIVLAGTDNKLLQKVQDVFMNNKFRVYTNNDVIGVEIGGAVKNVIALGAGIIEGLGLGDNAKAALITRGLVEIIRLGTAMGAQKETFTGLAGLGDLIVTCGSVHSRNFRAGKEIGKGRPWNQVLEDMGMVVEGVYATENTYKLAKKYNVEMPITEQMYALLYEGRSPQDAMWALLTRSKTQEILLR
ncbi:MAG: NAD(P)H-dependent glycerol-3-phosphate dehydrogenase [Bacillota bacterium]|jgi:glycerol-3-phosphate dehydrogenase (NAD(P)+)